MKRLLNLKLVLIVGILQTMFCLYELMRVIDCEMGNVDCSYFFISIWVNFPVSLAVSFLLMVLFDHLHFVTSFGAQMAVTAFSFVVVGTIWWTVVLTLIDSIFRKLFDRAKMY